MTGDLRTLSLEEAADQLGVTPHWLQMAARRQEVPHVRFGPRVPVRFTEAQVAEILAAHTRGGAGNPWALSARSRRGRAS